jgi:hypothetical protein
LRKLGSSVEPWNERLPYERGLGFCAAGLAEVTASGEFEKVCVVEAADAVGNFDGDTSSSSSSSLRGWLPMRGCFTASVAPFPSSEWNNPHGWPKLDIKLGFGEVKDADRVAEEGETGLVDSGDLTFPSLATS